MSQKKIECIHCNKVFNTSSSLRSHRARNKLGECKTKFKHMMVNQLPYNEIVNAVENMNATSFSANKNIEDTEKIRQLEIENANLKSKISSYVQLLRKNQDVIKRPQMSNPRRNKIAFNQGWKCGDCFEMLPPAFEIDHKIRWHDSFDDSDENLRALCISCHKIKTANENSNKKTASPELN